MAQLGLDLASYLDTQADAFICYHLSIAPTFIVFDAGGKSELSHTS